MVDKTILLVPMVNRDLPSAEARDDERQTIRCCDADDRETMFRLPTIARNPVQNQTAVGKAATAAVPNV